MLAQGKSVLFTVSICWQCCQFVNLTGASKKPSQQHPSAVGILLDVLIVEPGLLSYQFMLFCWHLLHQLLSMVSLPPCLPVHCQPKNAGASRNMLDAPGSC